MHRRAWTYAELAHLLSQYQDTPTADLAARMGRSITSVYQKAQNLGLKKSQAYLDSPASGRMAKGDERGKAGRFSADRQPWNKGKKGWQAGGRSAETQFKPGDRRGRANHLYQPIGTERITENGYRQVKVNDDMPMQRRWKMLHAIVWEKHHGPIPKNHAVTFKDGDRSNCAIANLALISRSDLMRRNTIQRYPEELRDVMRLKGRVTRKINERGNA